jgi:crossover junction endodeoxyribonuclease RuvC
MIIACDPGIYGALCLNDWTTGRLEVVRMPTQTRQIAGRKLRTVIDEGEVLSIMQAFACMGATHLFIEAVGGMPGQSAPHAFTFGQGYGAVRMAALACGLALEAVPPSVWKAAMKVPKDKHAARQRASEMIPTHKHLWSLAKDDGLAEAALLSLYGQRWVTGGVKRSVDEVEDIAAAADQRERTAARAMEKANVTRARLGRPLRTKIIKSQGF